MIDSHSDYHPDPHYWNDIAMVKTENMTLEGMNAMAAKLPEMGYYPETGTMLNISGFGLFDSSSVPSQNLQIAELIVKSPDECIKSYTSLKNQFCAAKDGVSAGYDDSGGPGVNDGTLIGILLTQWPQQRDHPELFLNVGNYTDWINGHIAIR
ncbi:hypothetical protein RDWZM_001398 [Blomia tropicalis]|uniref:Peptidase S1 domain-containing protein n=1 Tax=Blomia tropicalis TaxID=40697 RepID=A0A9Q0MD09_BLOTA|nr:hypothetical protein RDWZM_001398 [Blomia tropicalis]